MFDIAEDWLKSGEYAEIAGHRLRPIENPFLKGTPLRYVRGQARAYFLRDDNNFDWILKKFLPGRLPDSTYLKAIQSLVPRLPGFQSGYLRKVLTKVDLSKSGFFTSDFASFIENTVLMPRIMSDDWAFLTEKMRSGTLIFPNDERLLLTRNFSQMIRILEENNLSHRNLSSDNVFIDMKTLSIQIIDWDEIFHATLAMPPHTSSGTGGYIAPFVNKSGSPCAKLSWRPGADRFSMAILNTEFLSLHAGSPFWHDGGLFRQGELYKRNSAGITRILDTLKKNFPSADSLLKRALDARSFDECPSPAEWIAFSSGVALPFIEAGAGPALSGVMPPIQFYSCFISYSNKDEEFAKRLYSRLRDAGLRVWFAPEDVKGGQKLFEQVDRAIQMHDRLLVVLSESSLRSKWVEQEIRRAREFERKGGPRKLFPIRMTDFETLQEWVCMDTLTGEDLAEEVRSYFIPDFSNWKSYDDFEKAFERLLEDLKPGA